MMFREELWRSEDLMSIVGQLILCILLALCAEKAGSSTLPEGGPRGGEVVLGVPATSHGPERAQEIPVILQRYGGGEVTALQLTVVCEWPYHLEGVTRGPAIKDSTRWRVFSEIRSGIGNRQTRGADTIRIVLLSTSLNGIGSGDQAELFWLAVRPRSPQEAGSTANATMHISEVVGALSTGSNADINAGSGRVLMGIGQQR
jgi:hypothetical protein